MTTRQGRGRRARYVAALVGALLLLALPATAAAAVPTLPDPVQDVVDTVEDVAGSDDPIGEVVDAVDDAVGDVTGTEDPIEDVVDDVTDTVDDVVDDTSETADDVVDDVRDTAQDVVDEVDEATGGTVGDVIGGGQGGGNPGGGPGGDPGNVGRGGPRGTSLTPDGLVVPRSRRGAERGSDRSRPGAPFGSIDPSGAEDTSPSTAPGAAPEPSLGERLRQAAIDASRTLAVPLALMLVVLSYLIAQYWADRKDPKLVLAPVDADHDLLSFR